MLMLALSLCLLGPPPDAFTFAWEPEGERGWEHRALVERPNPEDDLGAGVMLFGGGLSADLHWTTPGSYEHEGERQRFTISGEDTRDADTLAASLLDSGFTVLRYSAIREGDPLHAQNAAMAQAKPFPETVRMANAAWDALLDRAGLEAGEVFVVGHSLGAPRSLEVSDGEAAGYVLLAGAYVTPARTSTRALAAGVSEDDPGEDYDGSGDIVPWERAACRAIDEGTTREADMLAHSGEEYAWVSDRIGTIGAPVLAVWGGLDPMSYHGPVLEHLLPGRVETRYFPACGHNLGLEEGGMTGPIHPGVVDCVRAWLIEQAGEG